MNKDLHVVGAMWRDSDVAALDQRVISMNDWLDHTEDLIEMFGDDTLVTDLQSMAGLVRTRRNDVQQETSALRAIILDRNNA